MNKGIIMIDQEAIPTKTRLDAIVKYLSTIWRYRLLIIIVTGVVTILVTAFCAISVILPPDKSPMPNLYQAQATILVQQNNQSNIADSIVGALGIAQSGDSSSIDNGDLIIEVFNSRMITDALIDEFHGRDSTSLGKGTKGISRIVMKSKIQFTYSKSTGAMKFFAQDADPVYAKNLVNKTVGLLESWFTQNRDLAKQKQRQSLEDKISEVKASIESLQKRLKSLQNKYGVLNVEELGQTQAASLANLRSQLILKDVEIKNYTSFSKIDDPRLEQLKEERQNLLDLIAQNQKKLPETQDNGGASGSQMTLPDVAQEFSELTLELDIQQRIYNTLSPQYEAAKLAPESEPIFQVLELADVPDMKSGPQRPRIILGALAASFLGSIALSFLINAMRKLNLRKIGEMIIHGGP
jgi:tyrosine-protein kinase Etk/Wzc